MKRSFVALITLFSGVWLLGPASGAGSNTRLTPEQRLDRAIRNLQGAHRRPQGIVLDNFRLIGHSDLGGLIDYGDVFAHGNFAYVGTRCGDHANGGRGVQVVDITDPTSPTVVSNLRNPRFTRAEDVTVRDVQTPTFTGSLAVVGIQACFGSGHLDEIVPGLRFFDVNDPSNPVLLSEWDLPKGTIGCHEIDAVQRADGQVLAVCARNLIDAINTNGAAALHIVNATDPENPVEVTSWTNNIDPFRGLGCIPFSWTHSARFEDQGQSLYASYWDAGTVHLDLADPANPVFVSSTKIAPPDEDGDNHSMTLANSGQWLVINPEDFSPSDCPGVSELGGYGEAYVYNQADPANPVFLGTFSTGNSRSTRTDGIFDLHNTEVSNYKRFFSSWYSDGIVWWTMDDRGVSEQLGQFVPPSGPLGPPLVWGVYIDSARNLILASDILSGLWIVRPKG